VARPTKERSRQLEKARAHAVAVGQNIFLDPLPCPKGHAAWRYLKGNMCRQCGLEYTPKWRAKNPEKVRESGRRAWVNNKDGRKKSYQKYQQANHHKTAFWARKRRALIRKAGGSHTLDEIKEIFEIQKKKCAYFWRCGKRFKCVEEAEVDHIVPISRGGTDDRRNLQILCYTCNRQKWATDQIDFMQSQGALL
jgi:5-methylcytosine-specific restriction endonuclease McrA